MKILKAEITDVENIVRFIDSTFMKEGYGFVTSAQINTEVKRGSVWVAKHNDEIVGVRVGVDRVYNLTVHPDHRKKGIGGQLINIHRPVTIRVKSAPVGNMSKEQRDKFTNPEPFYESLGYEFKRKSYSKNFWQRGKGDESHFHKIGKSAHIKIYQDRDVKGTCDLFLDSLNVEVK